MSLERLDSVSPDLSADWDGGVFGQDRQGKSRYSCQKHRRQANCGDLPVEQAELKALDCALRILGRRAHSQAEVRQKLKQRGFSPQVVASVVQRVVQLGYVDDLQFAKDYVRLRGSSLGVRRLKNELTAKGVSNEIQLQVLDTGDNLAEWQKALQLAKRKLAASTDLPRETRERRALGFLVRRGFGTSLSVRAIRTVLAEENDFLGDTFGGE